MKIPELTQAQRAYLETMRSDCITAAGAATIAGLPEVGKVLALIASAPLDKLRKMRYNPETLKHTPGE